MSIVYGMITVDTDYDAEDYVNLINCDTTSNIITITLPSTPIDGTFYIIKDLGNASAFNITVDGNGHNINGAATVVINVDYEHTEVIFCSTNNKWLIV